MFHNRHVRRVKKLGLIRNVPVLDPYNTLFFEDPTHTCRHFLKSLSTIGKKGRGER